MTARGGGTRAHPSPNGEIEHVLDVLLGEAQPAIALSGKVRHVRGQRNYTPPGSAPPDLMPLLGCGPDEALQPLFPLA